MEYFSVEELTKSETAARKGLRNEPGAEERKRLEALIENVLDPLRRAWGKPIKVNSGYRSKELNAAVGGAKTSQHMRGEAADISAGSKDANKALMDLAVKLDLPYDQVIDEKGYSWVHISYTSGHVRHQILHL